MYPTLSKFTVGTNYLEANKKVEHFSKNPDNSCVNNRKYIKMC